MQTVYLFKQVSSQSAATSITQRHYSDVQNQIRMQFIRHHRTKDGKVVRLAGDGNPLVLEFLFIQKFVRLTKDPSGRCWDAAKISQRSSERERHALSNRRPSVEDKVLVEHARSATEVDVSSIEIGPDAAQNDGQVLVSGYRLRLYVDGESRRPRNARQDISSRALLLPRWRRRRRRKRDGVTQRVCIVTIGSFGHGRSQIRRYAIVQEFNLLSVLMRAVVVVVVVVVVVATIIKETTRGNRRVIPARRYVVGGGHAMTRRRRRRRSSFGGRK